MEKALDPVRKLIADTAKDKRIELKDMSLRLGKNHAYVHQFIYKGTPKKLHPDDRALISQILGIPESDLGEGSNKSGVIIGTLPKHPANANVLATPQPAGPLIPLYGTVVGGIDGQFELNGNLLDRVKAPPSLAGVRGAYAVRVTGESMEPRYEDGETVYIDPERRPTRNDYVVAQIWEDENAVPLAYIKKFVRWNSEHLVLSQFNPPKELVFESKQVKSVHYILRSGE